MRILLLGNTGQLGWELERALAPLGQIQAVDYPDVDLTETGDLRAFVRAERPDLIINATAYTAVDRAESEVETAMSINAEAPGLLAEEARNLEAGLIHYSTDFVFDGTKDSPYRESDLPNPLNAYGRTKLAGEEAVAALDHAYLILRTAWVYSLRRPSFVTKVMEWSRQQERLRVVTDQVSNPTWARMLAEATSLLLAQAGPDLTGWLHERRGLYHLAGSGYASRMEWAQEILKNDPHPEDIIVQSVEPAMTGDFPTPARRPLFSALNCERFTEQFGLHLPDWRDALKLAMVENA